jgi:hypothetical protein
MCLLKKISRNIRRTRKRTPLLQNKPKQEKAIKNGSLPPPSHILRSHHRSIHKPHRLLLPPPLSLRIPFPILFNSNSTSLLSSPTAFTLPHNDHSSASAKRLHVLTTKNVKHWSSGGYSCKESEMVYSVKDFIKYHKPS